jgi:hypothetical protein
VLVLKDSIQVRNRVEAGCKFCLAINEDCYGENLMHSTSLSVCTYQLLELSRKALRHLLAPDISLGSCPNRSNA